MIINKVKQSKIKKIFVNFFLDAFYKQRININTYILCVAIKIKMSFMSHLMSINYMY